MARLTASILAGLALTGTAHAQTTQDGFVVPPDVDPYVAPTIAYPSGSTVSVVGDGSTNRGGTMPVLANQPADIPSTATGWKEGSPSYVTVVNKNTEETKARFLGDFSHMNKDDVIRNYGQVGAAHWHCYFGNTTTNAFSTFQSLRDRANEFSTGTPKKAASTVSGGPYNATGYWHPCVMIDNPFGDGKDYVVKPQQYVIYYTANPANKADYLQRIPRGLRYIIGTNVDDPYDTAFKAEIAAANAQPGTAGRYAYRGNGFDGWQCHQTITGPTVAVVNEPNSQGNADGFTTSTGTDPWGGNCTAGMYLVAHFSAPDCYDGINLWAPGGYKHLRQRVDDNARTDAWEGCPNGWFILPQLVLTIWHQHQGWTDYQRWELSSDDMATAAAQAIDPGADPMLPGQSMHTDWFGAWDDTVFLGWQDAAFGVNGNTTYRALNDSAISTTERLVTGTTPDGTRGGTQIHSDDLFSTDTAGEMIEVPSSTGPVTVPIHQH